MPYSETAPLTASTDPDSADKAIQLKRLKDYQKYAFLVTFLGYFMAHFSRKCYSTVKKNMEEDAGYSPLLISEMDSIFMGTYAVGNIVSGKLGDTFRPTNVLSLGLYGSGVCLSCITVALVFDFHGMNAILGNFIILFCYFLFGFFQSTGGPVGTAVMGNWFCDAESVKNRGLIYGLWTCHQYMGDVTAQLCAAWVMHSGIAYWWALLIPAVCNLAWGVVTQQLVPDPAEMGIITDEVRVRLAKMEAKRLEGNFVQDEGPKPISFIDAFKIPMVLQYAVAFGFFKLTNYTLFFWLPYFLEDHFDPVQANLIASLYSVGMMPGGIIVGVVSDIFGGRRAAVIGVFMSFLFIFLFVFAEYSEDLSAMMLLPMLAIMGILVGGPNNIITSAVAADLAEHPSVKGSNKSLGTVTGLINGTGAITASIGLLAIGPLSDYSWAYVWYYIMGCTFVGTSLMGTKIYSEVFGN